MIVLCSRKLESGIYTSWQILYLKSPELIYNKTFSFEKCFFIVQWTCRTISAWTCHGIICEYDWVYI